MYILGVIYDTHDTAACLIKQGQVLGFIEEERLNREKHTTQSPFKAIDYLLDKERITIDQISYIAVVNKGNFRTLWNTFRYALNFKLWTIPFIILQEGCLKCIKVFRAKRRFRKRYNYKGNIISVEHHSAHLASAFLVSPFKKSALLSIDGSGECLSSRLAIGEGN